MHPIMLYIMQHIMYDTSDISCNILCNTLYYLSCSIFVMESSGVSYGCNRFGFPSCISLFDNSILQILPFSVCSLTKINLLLTTMSQGDSNILPPAIFKQTGSYIWNSAEDGFKKYNKSPELDIS